MSGNKTGAQVLEALSPLSSYVLNLITIDEDGTIQVSTDDLREILRLNYKANQSAFHPDKIRNNTVLSDQAKTLLLEGSQEANQTYTDYIKGASKEQLDITASEIALSDPHAIIEELEEALEELQLDTVVRIDDLEKQVAQVNVEYYDALNQIGQLRKQVFQAQQRGGFYSDKDPIVYQDRETTVRLSNATQFIAQLKVNAKANLEGTLKELEQELEETKGKAEQYEEVSKILGQERESWKKKEREYKGKVASLEGQLTQAETNLHKEVAKVRQQYESQGSVAQEHLQHAEAAMQRQAQIYQQEKQQLEQRIGQAQEEARTARENLQHAETAMQRQAQIYQQEKVGLEQKVGQLQKELSTTQQTYEQKLKQELAELKARDERNYQELSDEKARVSELKEELNTYKENNHSTPVEETSEYQALQEQYEFVREELDQVNPIAYAVETMLKQARTYKAEGNENLAQTSLTIAMRTAQGLDQEEEIQTYVAARGIYDDIQAIMDATTKQRYDTLLTQAVVQRNELAKSNKQAALPFAKQAAALQPTQENQTYLKVLQKV